LRFVGRLLVACTYRVRTFGLENLPEGGFLLLPNHLTWVDAVVLQAACPRSIRFIIDEGIFKLRWLNPIFRIIQALPISSRHAKEGVRAAAEASQRGEIVCIFPEGELSRSGLLLRLRRGYELIARQASAPVVPVWLDQLWGSIFSFKGGKYFFKWPQHIRYPVTVAYGVPIPAAEAGIATVRERFLLLGEKCYQKRPGLRRHLAEACIRGLKRHPRKIALIDGFDHSQLSRGMLLAAAIALSRRIAKACPEKRVALVLPSGKGAVVANLAVVLAGKTPVNLNFTAGRGANESAIRIGGIRHCLTARAVEKRLGDFPWPEKRLHLEDEMKTLKLSILFWRIVIAITPAALLTRLLGLPRTGDHTEALVLFTSGSAGEPKGVVLSHRNILGNVSQFALMLNLSPADAILANLPFFHSFGCTVTLWYPLIEGIRTVTFPNPLEVTKNAELIHKYKITLFCTTPTFLRGYLRRVEPDQLASVELLVTGAEKLPDELAHAFHERFGAEVFQGYGLTETSPVAATNLPDPKPFRSGDAVQPAHRQGSVGRLAPGMAAQIRDPESDAPLTLHDVGMLWLRGPNIFEGYLSDPQRTADVIKDGWFKTGDLGRFDEDGFLFIEGRLSRFSKIGGEMVPHETIESKIYELLALPKDERVIAMTAVPDEDSQENPPDRRHPGSRFRKARLETLQGIGFGNGRLTSSSQMSGQSVFSATLHIRCSPRSKLPS
jgi:acyl-[acyl-carrier-protein]-phospholipid O-acyltransferase/long-chain-fatty-acid--[acyl-carrier-protein] ligase